MDEEITLDSEKKINNPNVHFVCAHIWQKNKWPNCYWYLLPPILNLCKLHNIYSASDQTSYSICITHAQVFSRAAASR